MHDIQGQYIFVRFVDQIILFELLDDMIFIIDKQGIELVGHELGFFMERNRFCDIFAGKDIGFSDGCSADHDLVVILILFGDFFKFKMSVGHVHDIMESFLAD